MRRTLFLISIICIAACASRQRVTEQTTKAEEKNIPPAASAPEAPPADDRYEFADGFSSEQTIALTRTAEGVRLVWPKIAASQWDTALLAIRSWGSEAAPWLEISAGASRIEESLDPNARGLRWLNLSALHTELSNGATVQIRAHAITIDPATATLRVFANKLDLQKTILILAPHPDDAEIAAFGLYADRNATIVTVTSGNAGDMNYRASISDPAEHYLLKGYLRAVDSVTVPWQGGIPPQRALNLGYFDARLKTMHETPDQVIPELYGPNDDLGPYRRANISTLVPTGSRKNSWNNLVADLAEIIGKVKPAIIVMPQPWLDSHLDHDYSSVALVQALEQSRENSDAIFLLYTNHAAANRYPYGPAGSVMSLPPWSQTEIYVERVYSHPVDLQLQRRKLFALESMHDLRLSPEEQSTCEQPGLLRRPDYPRVPETDYLRRGPRSNELFFVYNYDGVKRVIHSFLERPQQQ